MRHTIARIVVIAIFMVEALIASAQFSVGIRNTRFVEADYKFKCNVGVGLSHSLYAEKIAFQEIKASVFYENYLSKFDYRGTLYGSTTWNRDYKTVGAKLDVRYNFVKSASVMAALNPHYDTGYDYRTCFSAGAAYQIIKPIAVKVLYTTIPDYRMSEKRIHAGFDIVSGALSVAPVVSIPVEGNSKLSKFRVLMSARYSF